MSKGNMFLGFARGKVGDVVFTRSDGEQVTRVRNRSPKNPKTARQSVQRSLMKTVSQAYSLLQPICDHSFEGLQQGTPNQSRFSNLNLDWLRAKVLEGCDLSDDADIMNNTNVFNISQKTISDVLLNPYVVSEGILPALEYQWVGDQMQLKLPFGNLPMTGPSYSDVCTALGISPGDQLTFLWLYGDDVNQDNAGKVTRLEYSRVVMMPSTGQMGQPFFDDNTHLVLTPNQSNEGRIWFDQSVNGYLEFRPAQAANGSAGGPSIITACAVIVSRLVGSSWKRSTQRFVIRDIMEVDAETWYLGDAVRSFMATPAGSSLYLNQAE